jgi:hypothetical protein
VVLEGTPGYCSSFNGKPLLYITHINASRYNYHLHLHLLLSSSSSSSSSIFLLLSYWWSMQGKRACLDVVPLFSLIWV